jgi:hypothetical protein
LSSEQRAHVVLQLLQLRNEELTLLSFLAPGCELGLELHHLFEERLRKARRVAPQVVKGRIPSGLE